ncbi:hypothetical protein [Amphritea pacifica]|uniref:hypothetical protein n=1 Tax=Amphritea pacifica TaxID=2811233 RepID=UPI001965D8F0|nr:hypothetical protein [Amphritea pacifica]MBN1009093.1 hypothetical protein [Amphritea pacifica]
MPLREEFTVKAIKVSYNDREFYLSAISVKKLFSMTAVVRAEENNEDGYQRNLATGRVKKSLSILTTEISFLGR